MNAWSAGAWRVTLAACGIALALGPTACSRADIVNVPVVGRIVRGNTLSEREIGALDPWCELRQQDGGIVNGAWSWGWRDGPIFHGASRVTWDNDPRPAPRLVSVPSNMMSTGVGIDKWCRVATEAQLRGARQRRDDDFRAEWGDPIETPCPAGALNSVSRSWRHRDGIGWMGGGCVFPYAPSNVGQAESARPSSTTPKATAGQDRAR